MEMVVPIELDIEKDCVGGECENDSVVVPFAVNECDFVTEGGVIE
jgi:hypothetical protein